MNTQSDCFFVCACPPPAVTSTTKKKHTSPTFFSVPSQPQKKTTKTKRPSLCLPSDASTRLPEHLSSRLVLSALYSSR
jgi:hypothetical protein